MSYKVKLPVFEGPLDLLLHLVRQHEVEIENIPIARITEDYFRYLDMMKDLNLDVAGEFIVMAATLMYIKSRTLLPVPENPDAEEEEDPRQELIERLAEYKKYKEAALRLSGMEENQLEIFARPAAPVEKEQEKEWVLEVSLFDLLSAFKNVLEYVSDEAAEILGDQFPVEAKIIQLGQQLSKKGSLAFSDLLNSKMPRAELISTFLAVLELIRLGRIMARQSSKGIIRLFARSDYGQAGTVENS